MKKIMTIVLVMAAVAGVSSCKKSYTCTCENTTTGAVTNVSVKASSATDAVSQCAAQTQGGTSTCAY